MQIPLTLKMAYCNLYQFKLKKVQAKYIKSYFMKLTEEKINNSDSKKQC